MSKSVTGKFFFAGQDHVSRRSQTFNFLQSVGLFTWLDSEGDLHDKEVQIEFYETPKVMKDLIEAGYLRSDEDGHRRLYVNEVSDRGILFYIAYPQGDGFIFVPYQNVRTMHTVDSSDVEAIQQDVRERNVKAA
jgi:hypothetical protein